MTKHNPTQTAFDRIQRAAAALPLASTNGNTTVDYLLRKDGILIKATQVVGETTRIEKSHLVSWNELAFAEVDPIIVSLGTVLLDFATALDEHEASKTGYRDDESS